MIRTGKRTHSARGGPPTCHPFASHVTGWNLTPYRRQPDTSSPPNAKRQPTRLNRNVVS